MPLGIKPTVDFAFKKIFGSPENKIALISLLNAILSFRTPITEVAIVNPFNYQDFENDKLSILDVKATNTSGEIYSIEMQLSVIAGLIKRIFFYGCELYVDQLRQGGEYAELQAAYSICLLDGILWNDLDTRHHRFRLTDTNTGRVLDDCLEIHFLELAKYNQFEEDIGGATPLERWVYWFTHAHEYDAETLRKLFPDQPFLQATKSIEVIALKTEDKQMYDTREKALRDYNWAINTARREGRNEGLKEGRQEGRQLGAIIGTIQTYQELLKSTVSSLEDLSTQSIEELNRMVNQLQSTLRSRESNG